MTRRVVIITVVDLVIAALFQSVVSQSIRDAYLMPDMLLMMPVVAGLWRPPRYAAWLGLLCGAVRDFLAAPVFGVGLLVGLYTALLTSLLMRRDVRFKLLATPIAAAVITVLNGLAMTALTFALPVGHDLRPSLSILIRRWLGALPLEVVLNGLTALVVLGLFWCWPLIKREPREAGAWQGGVKRDVFNLDR